MLKRIADIRLDRRYRKLITDQWDAAIVQEKTLEKVKHQLRHTKVSNRLGLENIQNINEFLSCVPVQNYSSIEDLVTDTVNLKKKTLFRGRPKFVGLSSGTTGKNGKQIPYNRKMISVFKDFQTSLASIIHQESDYNPIRDNRITWGSTPHVDPTNTNIEQGYISGYLSKKSPFFLKNSNYPTLEVSQLSDANEKIKETARELKGKPMKIIFGVPSYIIHLLENLKIEWGVENFDSVWPDLNTIIYSGTPINNYREQLTKLIGHDVKFIGTYGATEGPFGFQIPALQNGRQNLYSFDLSNIFYTFRKMNEDNPKTLALTDLKPGDEVELLVTTPNGLVNYVTGDCIKIHSTIPYMFEVIGRIGQGMNVVAEKTSLSMLDKAIEQTAKNLNVAINHFFVCPGTSEDNKVCYEWTLLVDNPNEVDVEKATESLDQAMTQINGDYDEGRNEVFFLGRPIVNVQSTGLAKKYFQRDQGKGQLKMKTAFDSNQSFKTFINDLEHASV